MFSQQFIKKLSRENANRSSSEKAQWQRLRREKFVPFTWLDFSANCLLRASLFSCFLSSSCRVLSLWGTRVFTSFHLLCTSLPKEKRINFNILNNCFGFISVVLVVSPTD